MLRLAGDQVESLLDELLPVEVRELPAELAMLDRLLADPRLLAPIEQAWEQTARDHGRATIPMASFVRLMVIKQRTGWGYQNPDVGCVGLATPAPVLPAAADGAGAG
jgi:transposase, IS5 family